MICLRCGYCCIYYDVILPNGDHKPNNVECPYLKWKDHIAVCTIHGKNWEIKEENGIVHKGVWEETPCGQFSQIETNPNTPCRVGVHITKKQRSKKQ